MTPLTARSLLVGAAVVVVGVGVIAPVDGVARTVLLAAGACCAVLDVLLVRSLRTGLRTEPRSGAGTVVGAPDRMDPDPGPCSALVADGLPRPVPDERSDGTLMLGTDDRGRVVEFDPREQAHLVVVGAGVLAVAVFRAVAEQVRALATAAGAEVRVGSAPELRPVVAVGEEPCPALPSGTAVLAVSPSERDRTAPGDRLTRRATVVLVPGSTALPRRWDVAIEVGRSGCRVRRPAEVRGTPMSPPLPRLDA